MAKNKYSWSCHNAFYRMTPRGVITVLKREPYPKDFAKDVIKKAPGWIERPDKAKAKK